MQLSNADEYAIRAMLYLAAINGSRVTVINEICTTWKIPESFLRKILNNLVKAGLVISKRGINGGLLLARPADKITMLDVFEAVEGKLYLNKCLIGPEFCGNHDWCPVHVVWKKAQDAFSEVLQQKTLSDLVANDEFKTHFKIGTKN